MHRAIKSVTSAVLLMLITLTYGCAAEVGSEQWCSELKEKSKGDWTANELADFTKNCLFK
ncbi:MAG: DUF3012 domain-containing protein [Gammaproteobacteria bacterium]|nr:MAG: DUF3012 domain-containing protein [Gammaproteobacteria bacterium]